MLKQIEKEPTPLKRPPAFRAWYGRLLLPAMGLLFALASLGCDITYVDSTPSAVGRAEREKFPFGNIWGSADAAANPYGNAVAVDAPDNLTGTERVDVIINPKWRFLRGDVAGTAAGGVPLAATVDFVDSADAGTDWTDVDLPHSWNWTDGSNGPATTAQDQNYYRGRAWYRKHYTIPATMAGKKLFLQFDASSYVTDCWVNGLLVGTHSGGYAAFRFDITAAAKVGQDNVIAVRVDNSAAFLADTSTIITNSPTANVPPLNGDFTMFGGIYRDLHVVAIPALALSPFHFGSPGVYLRPIQKDPTTWTVDALIKLVNSAPVQKTAAVDLVIVDPTGNVVGTFSGTTTVPAPAGASPDGGVAPGGPVPANGVAPPNEYGSADLEILGTVTSPVLWDGLGKGNVYHAYVTVRDGAPDGGVPPTDAGIDAAPADAGADVSVAPDGAAPDGAANDASLAADAAQPAPFDIGTGVVDAVKVPLGFRTFSWDWETGWFLNGRSYPLRGVCMHQDHQLRAGTFSRVVPESIALIDNDFVILDELQPTFIRFAHYQHSQYTYDKADQGGYVAWVENAWVDVANATAAFKENVSQQMEELVYQNFNHPSALMWSCGNEILYRTIKEDPSFSAPFTTMVDCVKRGKAAENFGTPITDVELAAKPENRPIVYAQNGWRQALPTVWQAQIVAFNEYQGWYAGYPYEFARWADDMHVCAEDVSGTSASFRKANSETCWQAQPGQSVPVPQKNFPIGVSEYGAGANPINHDLPILLYPGDRTGGFQNEEYQAYFHEQFYRAIYERPFLVLTSIWNMFDFSSDNRFEGNLPGENTKGLVTFDRSVKKDAYYFYKANWSTEPMVYITSKRFDKLPQHSTTVKVYSNLPTVELFVNGTLFNSLTLPEASPPEAKFADPKHPRNRIFTFKGVHWVTGYNVVKAVAHSADNQTIVADSVGETGAGADAGLPEFTWFK